MENMPTRGRREGQSIGRLLMVLSSISPLFVLWAIKGTQIVSDVYFLPICETMVALPNLYLYWRILRARTEHDRRELVIGRLEDYRYHVLTYIFAMLLPFYQQDIASPRDLIAMCAALLLIIILFWKLNLHYINIIFIFRGYQTFAVYPHSDGNPYSGRDKFLLITRRSSIEPGCKVKAYRMSDTVYLESEEL